MIVILLFLLSTTTHAALPPGFEEELYCAAGCCLRDRVNLKEGFTGRTSMQYECCNTTSREVSRPWAWGVKLPLELKVNMLINGWHEGTCTPGEARVCPSSGRTHYTTPQPVELRLLESYIERVNKII